MPKLATYRFFTFFIFSFDALNEPPHVHIVKEKSKRQKSAKVWLHDLQVVQKGTLTDIEIHKTLQIIKENRELFMKQFIKVSQGKKVKTIRIK